MTILMIDSVFVMIINNIINSDLLSIAHKLIRQMQFLSLYYDAIHDRYIAPPFKVSLVGWDKKR